MACNCPVVSLGFQARMRATAETFDTMQDIINGDHPLRHYCLDSLCFPAR
jgi:hypothetical protein